MTYAELDRLTKIAADLERGEMSRTYAAAALRKLLETYRPPGLQQWPVTPCINPKARAAGWGVAFCRCPACEAAREAQEGR